MRLNPFASRAPAPSPVDVSPNQRIADRARAAQAKDSAEGRRTAKGAGSAARAALSRQIDENEARLEVALVAVSHFSAHTQLLLAEQLDSADPITQFSPLGRAGATDAGLPGWLRDRALRDDAERVVLDWLTFHAVFAAHREFSARDGDDPLPQLYEALSLFPSESLAVEGVETVGLAACTRVLHVAFALRDVQRTSTGRVIGSATGYAAADAWRAFDRSNRFVTAEFAEWIVEREPDDAKIAAGIASGRFSNDDFDSEGRSTGIAPFDIDEAALTAELKRAQTRV